MKKAGWLLGFVLLLGSCLFLVQKASAQKLEPPKTVEKVDLTQYVGKWYEIAAIPMFFERKCVANTTAEYTPQEDGNIGVDNSCQMENGNRQHSTGLARVVDPKTNAKLEVSFLSLPGLGYQFWASGDYWILDLAMDYSTAIVGHPTRNYGWILSRTPNLPTDRLKALAIKLKQQNYDPCKFIITPQTGGLTIKQPLCEAVKLNQEATPEAAPQ